MKKRLGFVSNSSSSSFLVAFEKPLDEYTDRELKQRLFGTTGKTVTGKYYGSKLDTDDLLRTVRCNAEEVKVNEDGSFSRVQFNFEEPEKVMLHEWFSKEVSEILESEGVNFDNDAYYTRMNEIADYVALKRNREWIALVRDKVGDARFYLFDFCDHTDIGAFLEHENIFKDFHHLYQNRH